LKLLLRKIYDFFVEKINFLEKKLILKLIAIFFMVIAIFLLFSTNKSLVSENKKMVKLIRNEKNIRSQFEKIKQNEELFYYKYILAIDKDTDLEKIKSNYINYLLELMKEKKLKVDSYRSEIKEEGNFKIFKYNISVYGDFIDVIGFFYRLREKYKYIYVKDYVIKLSGDKFVRMGLKLEIVGDIKAYVFFLFAL
jgi:hypothetical protein